jgi:hypothetical protein
MGCTDAAGALFSINDSSMKGRVSDTGAGGGGISCRGALGARFVTAECAAAEGDERMTGSGIRTSDDRGDDRGDETGDDCGP